jgi:hypothetical protein
MTTRRWMLAVAAIAAACYASVVALQFQRYRDRARQYARLEQSCEADLQVRQGELALAEAEATLRSDQLARAARYVAVGKLPADRRSLHEGMVKAAQFRRERALELAAVARSRVEQVRRLRQRYERATRRPWLPVPQ